MISFPTGVENRMWISGMELHPVTLILPSRSTYKSRGESVTAQGERYGLSRTMPLSGEIISICHTARGQTSRRSWRRSSHSSGTRRVRASWTGSGSLEWRSPAPGQTRCAILRYRARVCRHEISSAGTRGCLVLTSRTCDRAYLGGSVLHVSCESRSRATS